MSVFLDRLGTRYELKVGVTRLGRDPSCEICLGDASVSRHHLSLEVSPDGEVLVEDLGSTNGTVLKGRMLPLLKQEPMAPGDRLQVGLAIFVLRRTTTRAAREEAPPPPAPEAEKTLPPTAPAPLPTLLTCTECWSEIPHGEVCRVCEGGGEAAPPEQDRRSSPRVAVEFPVIYSSGLQTFRGVARDLGLGGVFVASNRWDPEVTPCRVTLLPNGERSFSIEGVVSRVGAYDPDNRRLPGLGIRFTDIPAEAMTWIHDTVEGNEWFDTSSTN
jgi:hypothetical protein